MKKVIIFLIFCLSAILNFNVEAQIIAKESTLSALTYGRVKAAANLAGKSFVSTGVGSTVDFTGTVYNSGTTFSGTNGIIPSVAGRFRASYYLNTGSDETANNAVVVVVQSGVELGSVYINQHNTAGSVNQSAGFIDVDVAANAAVFLHYRPIATELVAFDEGSYFQLSQLPTAVAPVVNTVVEYGENNGITNGQATGSGTFVDVVGGSFTLPSAGVWEVQYNLTSAGSSAASRGRYQIVRASDGAVVANSSAGFVYPAANYIEHVSQKSFITTTGADVYKLQFLSAGGTLTVFNANDGNGGNSKITWTKIAGQLSSTGQSVDYVEVYLSANTAAAANGAIIFNSVLSGNIPYSTSTGRSTLTAGKTYKLRGNVNIATSASSLTTAWYNVTAGAYISPNGTVGGSNSTTVNGSNQAEITFTPSVNTEVELRNNGAGALNISGGIIGVQSATASTASITQVGSSNTVGGNTNVSDQSSTGYFDIGTMRIQWSNTTSGTAVTFPAPFANANYSVNVNSVNIHYVAYPSAKLTTGFTPVTRDILNNSLTPGTAVNFIAIGQKP